MHLQVDTHADIVTKLSVLLQEDLDSFSQLHFRFRCQVSAQVERESDACDRQHE